MAENYIVKAVGKKIKDWDSQYGPMRTYLIQVEGNGEPIQLNKKAESPAPKEGDELYGVIEDTEWGQKFKGSKKPFSSGGGYTRDDAAIQAQWAIGQAREWIQYLQGDSIEQIEKEAAQFFSMISRIKGTASAGSSLKEQGDSTPKKTDNDFFKDSDMPEDFLKQDDE